MRKLASLDQHVLVLFDWRLLVNNVSETLSAARHPFHARSSMLIWLSEGDLRLPKTHTSANC